jgi:hypothetical protein
MEVKGKVPVIFNMSLNKCSGFNAPTGVSLRIELLIPTGYQTN